MGAATVISSPLETRQTLERRSDLFALMFRATRISGAVLHEGGSSASAKASCATGLRRLPPVDVTFRRVITGPCRATY